MLPPLLAQMPLIIVAATTVMGPVGPLIWLCVPPKREAKKPSMVAPTMPASAPIDAAAGSFTPPKA